MTVSRNLDTAGKISILRSGRELLIAIRDRHAVGDVERLYRAIAVCDDENIVMYRHWPNCTEALSDHVDIFQELQRAASLNLERRERECSCETRVDIAVVRG